MTYPAATRAPNELWIELSEGAFFDKKPTLKLPSNKFMHTPDTHTGMGVRTFERVLGGGLEEAFLQQVSPE